MFLVWITGLIGKAFCPALKGPRGKGLGRKCQLLEEKKNIRPLFCLVGPKAAFPDCQAFSSSLLRLYLWRVSGRSRVSWRATEGLGVTRPVETQTS